MKNFKRVMLVCGASMVALMAGHATAQQANEAAAATAGEAEIDSPKVYHLKLTGWFGEDISQNPIKQCLQDAKKLGANYIIVEIDNDRSLKRFNRMDEIKDEDSEIGSIRRAIDIVPEFDEKLETYWHENRPKIVYWVKTAMGGAAFLPMSCDTIYFHSDGRLGGVGHQEKAQLGDDGDTRVREKLFSAMMAKAEGLAIKGGYDLKIVRAMIRDEYVLSYKMEGGKPVYFERMPQNPGEILLTDDGKGENQDTIDKLARAQGNDCLTLYPDVARELGVSKGTVDTMDDLLHELGILRNHEMLKGRSAQIMQQWRDALTKGKRDLQKMWRDFNEVAVQGDFDDRKKARARRMRLVDDMIRIQKQYKEALNPNQIGVPGEPDLLIMRKDLELQQLADKR